MGRQTDRQTDRLQNQCLMSPTFRSGEIRDIVLSPFGARRIWLAIINNPDFCILFYIFELLLYKSLFTENSVATEKQSSASLNIQTRYNTKYNDQVHHSS